MMKRTRGLAYILANIDPALWASVKAQAAADGMTIRQFIFRALRRALIKMPDMRHHGRILMTHDGVTIEDDARDLLDRIGVEDAQRFTAGDLVELANIIADVRALRRALEQAS
jgi:hypothetical protein